MATRGHIQPAVIPIVQIRPNMAVIYNRIEWPGPRPVRDRDRVSLSTYQEKHDIKSEKTYQGTLSPGSKKRLQRSINLLVAQAEWKTATHFDSGREFQFKVNFVTLTLPSPQGDVSDKDIKKTCLDNWLKAMRYRYRLKSYVWRAERQYNGNVHFHVTTDTYLPFDNLCNEWNHQLEKLGLIDAFADKHGYRSPNSTDIHSVQKIDNLAAYMVKYMSKDPAEHLQEVNAKRAAAGKSPIVPEDHPYRAIEGQPTWDQPLAGKVWDCSKNLKFKDSCEEIIDAEIGKEIQELVDSDPDSTKSTDHCFLIFFNGRDPATFLTGRLFGAYVTYLLRVRNFNSS